MVPAPLAAWENFYIIVGSSAGALTGLLFVVITLNAGRRQQGTTWGVSTFTTPTVVHMGAVLFIAALLSAPWATLTPPALLLGLAGLGGIAYITIVLRRMQRRVGYQPVAEDWLGFVIGPYVAYAVLLVAALLLPGSPEGPLFAIGGAMLLLVVVGLHNAWDLATFISLNNPSQDQQDQQTLDDKDDASGEKQDIGDTEHR